jgi:hypothetical protein
MLQVTTQPPAQRTVQCVGAGEAACVLLPAAEQYCMRPEAMEDDSLYEYFQKYQLKVPTCASCLAAAELLCLQSFPALAASPFSRVWRRSIAMQRHNSAGVSITQHRAHLRWWRLAAQQRLPWHLPSSTSRRAGSGGQALLALTLLLLLLALHHALPCCLLSPHLTH